MASSKKAEEGEVIEAVSRVADEFKTLRTFLARIAKIYGELFGYGIFLLFRPILKPRV